MLSLSAGRLTAMQGCTCSKSFHATPAASLRAADSARIQLREGPAGGLRRTLRQAEEDFVTVSDTVRI